MNGLAFAALGLTLALASSPGEGAPTHQTGNVSSFAVADPTGAALYPDLLVLAGGKAAAGGLTASAAVFGVFGGGGGGGGGGVGGGGGGGGGRATCREQKQKQKRKRRPKPISEDPIWT